MSLPNLNVLLLSSSCCLSSLANHVWIGIITILLCLSSIISCEEECLRSKVWCYECKSIKDPYCSDPFNVSYAASYDKNLMELCEGCCVKIIQEKNTPQKNIWRTCTANLQINLFMVDHVCMEESGGQGHMCFCESDGCNSAIGSPIPLWSSSKLFKILMAILWPHNIDQFITAAISTAFPFGFLIISIPIYSFLIM